MHARARIIIKGSVQGVGYRNFVRTRAQMNNVTGWVANLNDGNVEAVLEGEKDAVEKVIEMCKKGPLFARVLNVSITWEDKFDRFSSFTIKH